MAEVNSLKSAELLNVTYVLMNQGRTLSNCVHVLIKIYNIFAIFVLHSICAFSCVIISCKRNPKDYTKPSVASGDIVIW